MTPHIRFALPTEHETLVHIWAACFGDPEDMVREFLTQFQPCMQSLLLEVDGQAAGALHLLHIAQLVSGDVVQPCPYIYAFGILPAFQGHGYGRQLASAAAHFSPPCALVPANGGLFTFYESAGFHTAFSICERIFPRTTCLPRPCAPDVYAQRREQYLRTLPHLRFSPVALRYAASLFQAGGGGFLCVDNAIAAVECTNGQPYIKELLGPDAAELAGGIAGHYGLPFCKARLPGGEQPFGMLAPSAPALQGAYFGFAFD